MEPVIINTYTEFFDNPEDPKTSKVRISLFVFRLDEVMGYNPSDNKHWTTLLFKNGLRFRIAIDFCTFDEFYKSTIKFKSVNLMDESVNYEYHENN